MTKPWILHNLKMGDLPWWDYGDSSDPKKQDIIITKENAGEHLGKYMNRGKK